MKSNARGREDRIGTVEPSARAAGGEVPGVAPHSSEASRPVSRDVDSRVVRRVAVINGHPDPDRQHFGHALAQAYLEEAISAGHRVKAIEVGKLGFPLLRRKEEWDQPLPPGLQEAQDVLGWADHWVLIFPLWLGTMPAVLKGFLEQVLRPGFAFHAREGRDGDWRKGLRGKSARIIVTMGMPALAYRWYFLAHGVKGLERNVLRFCGVSPVRSTFVGRIEAGEAARERSLAKVRALGRRAR